MNTAILYQSIHKEAKADFSRSSGPGGQNVNKVNTKVILRVRLADLSGLNEIERERLQKKLASRVTNSGELIVTASEERSQRVNLEKAYTRMEALITNSGRLPRIRRPTKPDRAAREERLNSKRRTAIKKAKRRLKPEN